VLFETNTPSVFYEYLHPENLKRPRYGKIIRAALLSIWAMPTQVDASGGNHKFSMSVCNVSAGSVVVSGSNVRECNGTSTSITLNGPLVIAGSTATNRVLISDADVTIRLSNVLINSSIPFVCNKSSVEVWIEGANVVRAADELSPGIECRSESNLSLLGLSDG
jgi:hypothetical protein